MVAALAGAAFGCCMAFWCALGLSQHVTGIGITLLATLLSDHCLSPVASGSHLAAKIEPFQPWAIPLLSDIPVVGEALFRQTPLTYLAFVAVACRRGSCYRTPAGLAVRTVGENPAAAEAQGIDVTWVRMAP